MEQMNFKLTGVAPLVMHNVRLVDPLDEWAQLLASVTKKKTKTIEDHEEIAKIECQAGLYLGDDLSPCIPAEWTEKAIVEQARRSRLGKQAEAGIMTENAKLLYDGPRTAEEIANSKNHRYRAAVGVQKRKVMRTRPIFRNWTAKLTVYFDKSVIDAKKVAEIVTQMGYYGLGERRPRFGRFTAEVVKS